MDAANDSLAWQGAYLSVLKSATRHLHSAVPVWVSHSESTSVSLSIYLLNLLRRENLAELCVVAFFHAEHFLLLLHLIEYALFYFLVGQLLALLHLWLLALLLLLWVELLTNCLQVLLVRLVDVFELCCVGIVEHQLVC